MNPFQDKYNLTPEQNLFLAKKKWDENVYCGMKMESRNITFPQTQTILNGVNVPNVTLDDIQAVLNMRDAWKYLLKTVDNHLNIEYACKLNDFVSRNESLEWGVLRNGTVGISGTDYIPPIPQKHILQKELSDILSKKITNTEKAIDTFLWGCKTQMFWDGNKRTSLLLANKILIKGGNGMLIIPENKMENFNTLLNTFYTGFAKAENGRSAAAENLKLFLFENAITGIEF